MTQVDLDPATVRGFLAVGVPTVCDIVEHDLGIRGWMAPEIKPLARTRIAGRAVTIELAPAPGAATSFDPMFAAVDACGPGSVLVVGNGGDRTISCMGDLVVAGLKARRAEGTVMDGAVRDIEPILEMGFPVFAASVSPVSLAGKSVFHGPGIPITCGGVEVRPGDVILADWDGVVVIPQEKATAVLEKALAKEAREQAIRERIREAGGSAPLGQIFAEFD